MCACFFIFNRENGLFYQALTQLSHQSKSLDNSHLHPFLTAKGWHRECTELKSVPFVKAGREEKADDVLKSSITLTSKSKKEGLLQAGFLFYDSFS